MPFATLSRRGRTLCAQAAQNHTVRGRTLRLAKSRLRRLLAGRPLGGCVRPYGSVGVDEFTSGVPRSYLRAPSLAALPQQSESTTGRAGRRVAMRPWAAITNHGRHAPNPKGRTDCSIAKSTCTGVCNDILPFATLSRLGAQCAPRQRKIIRFVGEHSDSLRAALRRLLSGRPLRWVCSPLRFSQCR